MALIDFFDDCRIVDKISHDDGFDGVFYEYVDGAKIKAGITTDQSVEAKIAYQNGLKVMYTIVFPATLDFKQDDLIRRMKDKKLFRVTSNASDMTTPDVSDMQFKQVSAEVISV